MLCAMLRKQNRPKEVLHFVDEFMEHKVLRNCAFGGISATVSLFVDLWKGSRLVYHKHLVQNQCLHAVD